MYRNRYTYCYIQHHQWNKFKLSGAEVTEINVLHNDIIKYTHTTIYIADRISGKMKKM